MKRILVSISTIFVLVLGLQVEVGGDRSGEDVLGQMHRLFYLFSPQVPEQCERARTLQKLVRSHRHQLQVIGVVRVAENDADKADRLEEFRRLHSLSYRLLTAAEALDDAEMPLAVKERLASPGDYVLLFDGDGSTADSGIGRELHRLLEKFAPVSTDVDESTWGKIKELFQ